MIAFIAFLATLGILVSFHEFGHYLAARACGVRVLRFSIGIGRPLFRFISKNQTEWIISAIPLGGYVKLLSGRDPEQVIAPADQRFSFDSKPLWQRSFIVAAGPFANFFLAVLLFCSIYMVGAIQLPAKLQTPPEQTFASNLGIVAGDQVIGWRMIKDDSPESIQVSMEGFEPIPSWNALRWYLLDAFSAHKGFILEILSSSGKRYKAVFLTAQIPKLEPENDPFRLLGLRPIVPNPSEWIELRLAPLDALFFASERVWLISKVSTRLMMGLFTGSTSFRQLGGPLSIADMAGKSAQVGWQPFLGFLALLSISIGILNLVPIPMLDGGQLLYDAWELVVGRRISISIQEWLQKISFFLLISLSFLALFNDLQHYLLP